MLTSLGQAMEPDLHGRTKAWCLVIYSSFGLFVVGIMYAMCAECVLVIVGGDGMDDLSLLMDYDYGTTPDLP